MKQAPCDLCDGKWVLDDPTKDLGLDACPLCNGVGSVYHKYAYTIVEFKHAIRITTIVPRRLAHRRR